MTKNQFIAKLNTILAHNVIDKRFEREKSGLINSKRLGMISERIFTKRSQEKLEKEYSIAILVDGSGSMIDGRKNKVAIESVCRLAEALERVRGVNFEITVFSGTDVVVKQYEDMFDGKMFEECYYDLSDSYVAYYQDKKGDIFDTLSTVKIDSSYTTYYTEHFGSNNHDAIMVYRTYKRLLTQSGKKILMTFSDGSPTISDLHDMSRTNKTIRGDRFAMRFLGASAREALRDCTNHIKRQGDVTLLGVGILSNSVEGYYQKSVVVNDLNELFPRTISLLSKVFQKV